MYIGSWALYELPWPIPHWRISNSPEQASEVLLLMRLENVIFPRGHLPGLFIENMILARSGGDIVTITYIFKGTVSGYFK
jgi:hypothetical protein